MEDNRDFEQVSDSRIWPLMKGGIWQVLAHGHCLMMWYVCSLLFAMPGILRCSCTHSCQAHAVRRTISRWRWANEVTPKSQQTAAVFLWCIGGCWWTRRLSLGECSHRCCWGFLSYCKLSFKPYRWTKLVRKGPLTNHINAAFSWPAVSQDPYQQKNLILNSLHLFPVGFSQL